MPVCLLEITLAVIYTWQSPPQSQHSGGFHTHFGQTALLLLLQCCPCPASLARVKQLVCRYAPQLPPPALHTSNYGVCKRTVHAETVCYRESAAEEP
jgi:hypothetical protein